MLLRVVIATCLTAGCAGHPPAATTPAPPSPPLAVEPPRSEAERCDDGDADACYWLGLELVTDAQLEEADDPLALDRAHEQARPWFDKACAGHHAHACGELGRQVPRCLGSFGGRDCNSEAEQSRWLHRSILLEKACDEGDAAACLQLGEERLEAGEPGKAHGYLRLACDAGDLAAARGCELLEPNAR